MTPVSPIGSSVDLSSILNGSDAAGPDFDANERFATMLETATNRAPLAERRDETSAKPSSERPEAPTRRQEEKDSSAGRSKDDEESVPEKNPGGNGKSPKEDKDKDNTDPSVTGDADDATAAPPPPLIKKPITVTSAGLSVPAAGASTGSAFVTELHAAVASTKVNRASTVAQADTVARVQSLPIKVTGDTNTPRSSSVAGEPVKTAATKLSPAIQEVPTRRATDAKVGGPDKLGAGKSINQSSKAGNGDKAATHKGEMALEVAVAQPAPATSSSPTTAAARPDRIALDKVAKVEAKSELKTESKAEPVAMIANSAVVNPFAPNAVSELSAVKPNGLPLAMEPFKQVAQLVTPLINRGNGDYSVTMQLHPAELGSVQVQVQLTNGQISMQLSADNQQARQSLQDSMDELRESLESSGLATGSLDVSTRNHSDQGGNSENGHNSTNISPSVTDKEQTNFLSRLSSVGLSSVDASTAGDGPLDVRV